MMQWCSLHVTMNRAIPRGSERHSKLLTSNITDLRNLVASVFRHLCKSERALSTLEFANRKRPYSDQTAGWSAHFLSIVL